MSGDWVLVEPHEERLEGAGLAMRHVLEDADAAIHRQVPMPSYTIG